MAKKKYTVEELQDPRNRARFISQMPISMRSEVLWQFEDMAKGGNGGLSYEKPGETIRQKHYKNNSNKPNSWFSEVLYEYDILERENGE